jgi:hypothetical protein
MKNVDFLQSICATNGAVYYQPFGTATPPAPISNIPMDQFATAVYPPGGNNIILELILFYRLCNLF